MMIWSEEFVKQVYLGKTEGPNWRGRPLGRWKYRVKEYMNGRDTGRRAGPE